MTENELLRFRSMRKEEYYLCERIEELNQEKTSIKSPGAEPSFGGSGEDKLTALISSIDKLTAILMEKQMINHEIECELETMMESLTPEERLTIRYYYIKAYLRWEDVARELQYSERAVFLFRASALEKLSKFALRCNKLHL